MSVTCREAVRSDAESMALARAAGHWTGGASASVMARYLAGEQHPQQALLPRVAYVAEAGREVVGFVAGQLTRRFGCPGEVQWLFVARAHRRGTIATALLHRLAVWFAERSASRVCVNVAPDNFRARAFYVRQGAGVLNEHWLEWTNIAAAVQEDPSRAAPAV